MNLLKTKSEKQEKNYQQSYLSLTDDYKRITEQFRELQKKFRHFQNSDAKKYNEVWKMNEERAMDLMRKLLQADQIIHEQQLGIKWNSPSEDRFKTIDPSFFHDSGESPFSNLEELDSAFRIEEAKAEAHLESDNDKKESLAAKFKDFKGISKSLKKMLELLCNEAGFLVYF